MRTFYVRARGFTLMEILVATGIVVLLSAVVIVNVSESRKRTRDVERESALAQLQIALRLYNDAYDTYNVDGFIEGGDGVAWISPPAGGENGGRTFSVDQALYKKGFLPIPALRDPRPASETDYGYMIALCDGGRRYALFATKEISSTQETEAAQNMCHGSTMVVPPYEKNYAVGN